MWQWSEQIVVKLVGKCKVLLSWLSYQLVIFTKKQILYQEKGVL